MFYYGSLLSRFLNACIQFFAAVLVLYLAVELVKAVWFALLLILLGLAVLVGLVLVVRRRLRGW